MLSIKAGMMALLLSVTLNGAGSCEAKKRGNVQNSNQPGNAGAPANNQPSESAAKDDLKPLAQGQHSPVSSAFIVVAREAETYAELRKLAKGLPSLEQDYFKSNVVVAAFLGERRTGGYGIRFTRAQGSRTLRIEETAPPKGAMVIQVITYPFSVVGVPLGEQEPPAIDAGDTWRAAARPYQVRNGEFTMTGGIMGRSEKFGIGGTLGVLREGNLATFLFNLQSKDGAQARDLKDVASGLVQSDGRITIPNLRPGSFVDPPADALRATGTFMENEGKLSLSFESIPGQIADGFNGRGSLNAEATAPAPPKKKASAGDVPQ